MSEKKDAPKREMSPEEMENYKNNLIKFYKSQMELLEPQVKYEEALTTIEELRTRRVFAQMKYAQVMAPPTPEEEEEEPGVMPEVPTDKVEKATEAKPRSLKKQQA